MTRCEDEMDCRRCGGPNPVWYAPDEVWNRVMRRDGVEEVIVCPSCFAALAEAWEPGIVRWSFAPETAEVIQVDVIEDHEVPEQWSDERMHLMDADCWCRPEVVRIERDEGGRLRERQVVHRREMPVEVLV